MSRDASDGWDRLDAERRWTRWLGRISPLDYSPTDWWGLLGVIGLAIVWALGVAALGTTTPRPRVNTALGQIRIGRRVFEFARFDRAGLAISGSGKVRGVDLRFGITRGPTLYVRLVVRGRAVVDAATRSLMVPLLEGSSIEESSARRERVDTGRDIAYGLTRDDAIAMVRNPPVGDADLPPAY
jgi:hypothetical protein